MTAAPSSHRGSHPFTSRSKNQSNSAKSEARVDQSTCAVPNPLAQGPHVGTLPVRIRYCLDAPPESVSQEADRDQTKQDATEGASCNDFQGTVLPGGAPAGGRPMSEYTAPSVAYPKRASRSIQGWAASLAWCWASFVRSPLELMPSSATPLSCA